MIIGLTGPIGSGKTEAVKIFKKYGFYVIEADKIGHKILALSHVKKKLISCFGKDIVQKGKINRIKLRKAAFSNKKNLKLLNSITHPEIKKTVKMKLISLSKKRKIVIDAALLKQIGLIPFVDLVIFIKSSSKNRLSRTVRSRKLKAVEARRIMKLQPSDRQYQSVSDVVITNDGSIKDFRRAVREFVKYLRVWIQATSHPSTSSG
jgi:dephospho-CoA kinase